MYPCTVVPITAGDIMRRHCEQGGASLALSPFRSKLERDRDRDVSEKIALGLPSGPASQESLFDQRLFNQTKVGECAYTQISSN